MLKAPPQRFRPRLVTAAPPYKATELGKPVHRLDQRGGLLWWSRALMDGTRQRLPFVEVQQDATGHVGHRPRQHCGIKNPPGNDTIHSILKFFQVDSRGMFRMTSSARYFKKGVGSSRPN